MTNSGQESSRVARATLTRFQELQAKLLKDTSAKYSDSTFNDNHWKLEPDPVGNASALIRFLYCNSGEEYPYVRLYTHAFKGPTGKWFIENCLTSIGKDCPVCTANKELWNKGDEASIKTV